MNPRPIQSLPLVASIGASLALLACGAPPAPASPAAGSSAPPAAAPSAAPAAVNGKTVVLTNVPLKGVAAGETADVELGKGSMAGTVKASNFFAQVAKAESYDPVTTADAEAEIVQQYSGKNIKFEKLSDGWLVVFDNTSTDGSRKNYWVNSRRKIGDTEYTCGASENTPERRANVVAFCKTLTTK